MKKFLALITLCFLVLSVLANAVNILAEEGSDSPGSSSDRNSGSDDATTNSGGREDNSNRGSNNLETRREFKKEFRENGRRIEVERRVETEDGKRKVKIERKVTDEQGNIKKVRIEIKEEGGKRKIKIESKEKIPELETELEIEQEEESSEIEATTSDGKRHKLKVLPDKIAEIARERLKTLNISNLTLEEIKDRNIPRVIYKIETNQNGRFLGIFKLAMKSEASIDPETGDVLGINRPWWAVLVKLQEIADTEGVPVSTGESDSNETDAIECTNDAECAELIVCPQVLGSDTQLCNLETNKCYCGSSESTGNNSDSS